ncbi:MAG TPA: FAD-linked oxidase C-terminal domain-containing protein [Anaerohalosphaeraceae bacterium]|nr:FAD-linked oxidase C-terminal domain-containing protein [Anaerohalosphaeraceae bacterium]
MKTAETIGAELAGLIKGTVRIDLCTRTAFSTDASIYHILPQCVVSPRDEQDIIAVVSYAAANQIPVAPRGAGSGLAGESLTSGIVIDCRRFMNAIVDTAPDGSWVRVQPGVVLDKLNAHLVSFGRKIGPDPSSSNRAVMGGVVANNATGAHSLQYGYIADYVDSVRVVLADGTPVTLSSCICPESAPAPVAKLASACAEVLGPSRELIDKAQPATKRNRCGYTLVNVVQNGRLNLARLMVGSEGTLGVFTEVTLRTVPVPAAVGLIQFEFASMEAMARAVPIIVRSGAAACELMDRTLMDMARQALPRYRDVLPAGCAAALLVEHVGDAAGEVSAKIEHTISAVGTLAADAMKILEPDRQAFLWKSRKDAVPLLNRQKGPSHPVAFIEDVSVDYHHLEKYILGLQEIGRRYDIPMAFYGHAGDGELHIRPYLDLSRPEEIERMRRIAEEVFALAWSLGGSISGEHGDGLLRAAFLEGQYGKDYCQLLRQIKRIFDPAGLMNPGKILSDDPDVMIKNLRAPALKAAEDFQTQLFFKPQEYRYEVEQCNGCGVCLARTAGSRMCPVFRGLDDELASSRAKANLIAAWMARQPLEAAALKDMLSLCINCKMCSIDCPAGVDVSKLVIEARTQLARQTGFSAAETVLSNNRRLSMLASAFSPLSNRVLSLGGVRWLLEKLIGLDRNRRFPHFEHGSFIRKARRHLQKQPPLAEPIDKAVYFVDSFANWNDHELGFAVLDVLNKLGIQTAVPPQRPAPLPAYVYGNLKTARKDLEYNVRQLLPYVQQGYKIVCSEPSAALCLKEEMRLILNTEAAAQIARNTVELMSYIEDIWCRNKRAVLENKNISGWAGKKFAYHAPCHLKALKSTSAALKLLNKFGVNAVDLNAGCCGLAGTAGMQKKHRDLSISVGRPLAEAISAAGADIILTECAACGMQIEHLSGKPATHPIKILCRIWQENAC